MLTFSTKGLALLLCALLFLLSACAKSGNVEDFLWPEREGEYYRVLRNWSRRDEIYMGLEGQISAVATLKSNKWRQAYVREKKEVYSWTKEKVNSFSRTMRENARRNTEFFLGLHGSEKEYSELDFQSSLWRVYVRTAQGKQVSPMEIREVDTPLAEQSRFFPYVNRWKQTYILRFPKVEEKDISLIITGPAGKLDLNW